MQNNFLGCNCGKNIKIFFNNGGCDTFRLENYDIIGVSVTKIDDCLFIPFVAIEKIRLERPEKDLSR